MVEYKLFLASDKAVNVPFCILCGEKHNFGECNLVKITKHVKDNPVVSRARLTLPKTLEIQKLVDGSYSVIAKTPFEKGTVFGPAHGEIVERIDFEDFFPLKLFFFDVDNNSNEYFLRLADESKCNWIMFVSPANHLEEQNLICYQDKDKIFYVSIKNIEVGDTLKVWYSPYYASKMNKNLLTSEFAEESESDNIDISALIKKQQHILDRQTWNCKFCCIVEKDVAVFAVHILQHYSAKLAKICEICKSAFKTRKLLKKHYSIVHKPIFTGSSSKPCTILQTSSNFATKDIVLGGHLINDVLSDSFDLPQNELNQFNLNLDNQSLLFDNEENLDFGNVKDLDHFNFEIDDNQKHFVCDICLKQFTKLKLLVAHLKAHTGRFLCFQCLKIFARNETLKSHVCVGTAKFGCSTCKKTFSCRKNLLRHTSAKHMKKFKCSACKSLYVSKKELSEHYCKQVSPTTQKLFTCLQCNKQFHQSKYLKRHSKLHEQNSKSTNMNCVVCDICGTKLKDRNTYYVHRKKHFGPQYMCQICDKKFPTPYTLSCHIMTHQNTYNHECDNCGEMFESLKKLQLHKSRRHLKKHLSQVHNTALITKQFNCPTCEKSFKFKSSLLRHIRLAHQKNYMGLSTQSQQLDQEPVKCDIQEETFDETILKPKVQEKISDEAMLNESCVQKEHDMSDLIPEINSNIKTFSNEKSPPEIFSHLLSDPEKKDSISQAREICLSIPDLTTEDQEITLGNNAYILENGTIVQPQESSDNVIIYVLNQPFT